GPLWLVALQAPAVLYGPYWAVLVSTLGIGGLLIAKLHLERWLMVAVLIIGSLATALVLTWTRSLPVVIAAQVVLALALAIIGNPRQPAAPRFSALIDPSRRVLWR